MDDLIVLAIAAGAGVLLGLAFFGSLRWTLARLPASRRPWLALAASLALRWTLLGAALALVVRLGGWTGAVAATAGLVAGRHLTLRNVLAAPERRTGSG